MLRCMQVVDSGTGPLLKGDLRISLSIGPLMDIVIDLPLRNAHPDGVFRADHGVHRLCYLDKEAHTIFCRAALVS